MGETKKGFFNTYNGKMPFPEAFAKDVSYALLWVYNYLKNGFQTKTILVHPHYPSRGSTIYKVGKQLNHNITNKKKKHIDFSIYWEYDTHRKTFQVVDELSKSMLVLNLNSRDISKVYVDRIHQKVFGYSVNIDPLRYEGQLVKKSDINAVHDGAIVQGPLKSTEPGYVYQLLINNQHAKDMVVDIRVPIVGKTMDFVYLKYKSVTVRFDNITVKTEIKPTLELFTSEEVEQLNAFCEALQLDYGELDVLRNKNDQKIYVVDVNNTPQGPPATATKNDAKWAINEIAKGLSSFISKKTTNKKQYIAN